MQYWEKNFAEIWVKISFGQLENAAKIISKISSVPKVSAKITIIVIANATIIIIITMSTIIVKMVEQIVVDLKVAIHSLTLSSIDFSLSCTLIEKVTDSD